MKLMKRILAIICTFVMIISMATGVNAVEPAKVPAISKTGTIKVANAKAGEKYKVYKILTLESYDDSKKAYSYVKNGDNWDAFIESNEAKNYVNTNSDGYVTFNLNKHNSAGAREFALLAMQYAKDHNIEATAAETATAGKGTDVTVEFTNLKLGYYLVESSVGTACSIDTTHPNAIIRDKHESPDITKIIVPGDDGLSGTIRDDGRKNSVNIGDIIDYEIIICAKPNAKNYVLHDKMSPFLKYEGIYDAHVYLSQEENDRLNKPAINQKDDFIVNTTPSDDCTFEISFKNEFYQKYEEAINSGNLTKITFKYMASVKSNAPINTAMPNRAHLSYGEHSKTDERETKTYTWGIPVFKYTGNDEALANAKFILSTNEDPSEENALKFTNEGDKYRYATQGGDTELVSSANESAKGMININGLRSGTYYLKETKAPDGYNLLKDPIKIVVEGGDSAKPIIRVGTDNTPVEKVKVQNNKGSLLPSTGGMGTTLIYVVGSILVLASGIVLFNKRKEGTN